MIKCFVKFLKLFLITTILLLTFSIAQDADTTAVVEEGNGREMKGRAEAKHEEEADFVSFCLSRAVGF